MTWWQFYKLWSSQHKPSVLDKMATEPDAPDFRSELTSLLNRFSKENGSNTPDWILRDYLCDCLKAFDNTTLKRDKWYGDKNRM